MAKKNHDKRKNKNRSRNNSPEHDRYDESFGQFEQDDERDEDYDGGVSRYEDEHEEDERDEDEEGECGEVAENESSRMAPLSDYSDRYDHSAGTPKKDDETDKVSFSFVGARCDGQTACETVPRRADSDDHARSRETVAEMTTVRRDKTPAHPLPEHSLEKPEETDFPLKKDDAYRREIAVEMNSIATKNKRGIVCASLAFCSPLYVKRGFRKILAGISFGFRVVRAAVRCAVAFLNRRIVRPIWDFNKRFSSAIGIEENTGGPFAEQKLRAESTESTAPVRNATDVVAEHTVTRIEETVEERFVDARVFDAPAPRWSEDGKNATANTARRSEESSNDPLEEEFDEEEYEAAIRAARKKILLIACCVFLLIGGFFAVQHSRGKVVPQSQLAEVDDVKNVPEGGSDRADSPDVSEKTSVFVITDPDPPYAGRPAPEMTPKSAQETESEMEDVMNATDRPDFETFYTEDVSFVPETPEAVAQEFDAPPEPEDMEFEDREPEIAEFGELLPETFVSDFETDSESVPQGDSENIAEEKHVTTHAIETLRLNAGLQNHRYTEPERTDVSRTSSGQTGSDSDFPSAKTRRDAPKFPEATPSFSSPNPPYLHDANSVEEASSPGFAPVSRTGRAISPFAASQRKSFSIAEQGSRSPRRSAFGKNVSHTETDETTGTEITSDTTPAVRDFDDYGRVYIAREGDNLFNIAKNELGEVSRWKEIRQLNRGVLGENVGYLPVGTELRLPL